MLRVPRHESRDAEVPRLKHQIIPRIQLKHITRNYFFSRPNFFTTLYDYYEEIWIIWFASKIDPTPKDRP